MRLGGLGQRIVLVDGDLYLAALDHLEQRLGAGFEILAGGGVGAEARARQIERALGVEDARRLRRDGAANTVDDCVASCTRAATQ